MKTKLLMVLLTFYSFNSYSQQREKNGKNQVEVDSIQLITIDYSTKSFKKNQLPKNLKTNSWIQFKIENLDTALTAEGNVNFTNKNLELKNSFAGYLNFDKSNQYINGKATTNTKDSVADKIKEIKKQSDSLSENKIDSSKVNYQKVLTKIISKTTKINEGNMIKALEVGYADNYLKNKEGKDAENARGDLAWQKKLIKILKNNFENNITKRDSLLKILAVKIDSLNAIKKIENPLKEKYFSPTKIENFDISEFNIVVKNKNGNIVDNFNIPFKNKCGFKLDYSTGFVFNGLQSKNYKIIPEGTDYARIKEEEKSLSFNTGIALLAHAYSRTGKFINYGLTTGLSFNLDNQNLNYMCGISSILGEDQRFILSLGITAGKIKELVKYYEVDKDIPLTELPLTAAVPTVEKLKATWFLSLTYNLGISDSSKTVKL